MAWNAASVLLLYWVVAEVLTRLHRALDAEREIARTDALTGGDEAGRSFSEQAAVELERVSRYGGVFSVAYLDLDHFKIVNDTMGHDAGDRLLRDVARSLESRRRRTDIVARLGGDEFVLFMPETDAAAAAAAVAHAREALSGLTEAYGAGIRASIGTVTFLAPPASVDEMLREADTAMYAAKYSGRDRVIAVSVPSARPTVSLDRL